MGLANMDVRLGNGCSCLSDALSLVRLVKIWRQTPTPGIAPVLGTNPETFG
jgi:hypothetical protein